MEYIWDWFTRLNSKRQIGMGLNPISYEAIAAWSRLYRVNIGAWEVKILDRLDDEYRSVEHQKANPPKQTAQDVARDAAELKAARAARAERRAARKKAKEG